MFGFHHGRFIAAIGKGVGGGGGRRRGGVVVGGGLDGCSGEPHKFTLCEKCSGGILIQTQGY